MEEEPRGDSRPVLSLVSRYDHLLAALRRALDELELPHDGSTGRGTDLQEAANIVFDLLYTLDYDRGGELVPRLAGVYAFLADELLSIGRTRDRIRLQELRRVVVALRAAA